MGAGGGVHAPGDAGAGADRIGPQEADPPLPRAAGEPLTPTDYRMIAEFGHQRFCRDLTPQQLGHCMSQAWRRYFALMHLGFRPWCLYTQRCGWLRRATWQWYAVAMLARALDTWFSGDRLAPIPALRPGTARLSVVEHGYPGGAGHGPPSGRARPPLAAALLRSRWYAGEGHWFDRSPPPIPRARSQASSSEAVAGSPNARSLSPPWEMPRPAWALPGPRLCSSLLKFGTGRRPSRGTGRLSPGAVGSSVDPSVPFLNEGAEREPPRLTLIEVIRDGMDPAIEDCRGTLLVSCPDGQATPPIHEAHVEAACHSRETQSCGVAP